MKYCEECGAALEDNAEYCEECGAKQSVAQEAKPPKENISKDKPVVPKDRKSFFILIALIVAVAIVAAFVFLVKSKQGKNKNEQPVAEKSIVTKEAAAQSTEEATQEPDIEAAPEETEQPTPEPTEQPIPEPTEQPTPELTGQSMPEPTVEPTPDYASRYSYLVGTYFPEDSIADHNYTGYDITIKQIKGDQVLLSIESWDNTHIIWNQETYGTIQDDKIYFETIWKDKWRVGYGVIYIPQDANFTSLAFELVTTGENAEYLGVDSVYMDTRGLYYMILDNSYAN